jgi:polysaccharide biosynthesis/export protein
MDLNSAVRKVQPSLMLLTLLGLTGVAAPTMAQTLPSRQAAPSQPLPGSRSLPPNRVPAAPTPVQVPQAPPQSSGAPLRVEDGYLLGSGDRIKLDIFGVPEYSGEYQVMADGSINLPLAGRVEIQGLTIRQASDTIAKQYREWLTRPVITVTLMQARPIQVAISGEVSRPGTYTTTLNDTGLPTLSRMVQMAGGINQSADLQRVQILRRRPGQSRSTQTLNVNVSQLLRAGDLAQDIQLRDGDTVVIPASTALDLNDSNQLATSSLGASFDRPISVVLAGAVNRPGPHSVQGETIPGTAENAQTPQGQPRVQDKVKAPTVTRAIQKAGGITNLADLRNIQVKRLTRSGSEQTIKVNLMSLLQQGDSRQDIPLQEGDRIVIPESRGISPADASAMARASFSPDIITVNVAGEVERPGAVQVPPNTTLNQALLAAGGFNGRARKGRIQFIRLQPDGTADRREIRVDFARGIDSKDNPVLQPGDTIVVGRSGFNTFLQGIGNVLSPALGIFGIFR